MRLQINFDFDDFFRIPTIKIGVNNTLLFNGNANEHFEFNLENVKGLHTLWIEHYGKLGHETTLHNDTHVFIKNILFDDIDLDQIDYCRLTHRGHFYPEYNTDYVKDCKINGVVLPEYICPNHYLGHNGIWKLEFEMPAMNWIIKEQNPSGMNLEDTMFSSSSQTIEEIKKLFDL